MVYKQFFEDTNTNTAKALRILFNSERNKKFIHIFFHNLLFSLKQSLAWNALTLNNTVNIEII